MHSFIRPNQYVAIRLPSDLTKLVQLVPNTYVICLSKKSQLTIPDKWAWESMGTSPRTRLSAVRST